MPFGWGGKAYAFLPGAVLSHVVGHYLDNLAVYQANYTEFEMVDREAWMEDTNTGLASSRA